MQVYEVLLVSVYPLTESHCQRLSVAFEDIPRVDLAIDCAIEGRWVPSKGGWAVLVDDPQVPSVFLLRSGPFAYLAGDPRCPASGELLESLQPGTLVMPSGEGWLEAVQQFFTSRLVELERYRFSSHSLDLDHLKTLLQSCSLPAPIQRMDLNFARSTWGTDHFVDLSAYKSPQDFLERGVGFYLARGEIITGAAFAALACSRGIEVSVYVKERFRQQGIGTALSCRLLSWCLERGLEPHWDAANRESYRLALRLGYTAQGSYLAYYLAE